MISAKYLRCDGVRARASTIAADFVISIVQEIFKLNHIKGGKYIIMREQEALVIEEVDLELEPEVTVEEKNLVVLEHKPKHKIDETISTPDRYVSRYHYDTRNIDAEMELCPHCKKPTFSAFHKVVADGAMNYLLEKEDQKDRRYSRRRNFALIAGGLAFLAGLYYWIFYIISGVRI
jgi:hypothetical protein